MNKWKGVVVLLIIAALVTWGLLHLSEIVNAVQGKYMAWKSNRQIEALEKPYRTDKIGGQTPEETFDLFISALKKGDTDLASKYFVLQKQESWKKSFGELQKNQDFYAQMISELEFARDNHNKNTENDHKISFVYQVDGDGGTKSGIKIIFEKYPTGVWKIDLL